MNVLNLIRVLLFAAFLGVALATGVSMLLPASQSIGDSDVLLFISSLVFMLILGPLWPGKHQLQRWSNFLDRYPITTGTIGYFILAISGVGLMLSCQRMAESGPSFRLRIVYALFGQDGIAFFWFTFGLVFFLIGVWRGIRMLFRHHA